MRNLHPYYFRFTLYFKIDAPHFGSVGHLWILLFTFGV